MGKDYYKILGVPRDATPAQLRKAYRTLAMQWHPDKHQNASPADKQKAENMFKDIAEAYDVLSDEKKKNIYDQCGEEGLKGGGPGGPGMGGMGGMGSGGVRFTHYSGVDPGDIFSRFFGASAFGGFDDDFIQFGQSDFGSHHHAPKQGEAFQLDLKVTLEDLFTGAQKRMKVTRQKYYGNTRRQEDKILDIQLKRGWKDGTKITFSGEGQQISPHHKPGDIVFVVRTMPHPRFTRKGDHLVYTANIKLRDCFTGTTITIETLDQRKLTVAAPAIITPKTRRVIAGEGMPSQKTGEKGDLIVEFSIEFPTDLTAAQKSSIVAALR